MATQENETEPTSNDISNHFESCLDANNETVNEITNTTDIRKKIDETQCDNEDSVPTNKPRLTKSEKKKLKHERILESKKESRKQKKQERKERIRANKMENLDNEKGEDIPSKREIKEKIVDKLNESLVCGQRICVDLSMEHLMSEKEKSKLAQQLGRLYGVNRHAEYPAHLYFCGFAKTEGTLYKECIRKNSGFEKYIVEIREQTFMDVFDMDELIYLSPDAKETLTDIDPTKVYIIGGLVDESVAKNVTFTKCQKSNIKCLRLPIQEYMEKVEQSSHSSILAVNQVFEILMTFIETHDWCTALSNSVPKRKGYVIK